MKKKYLFIAVSVVVTLSLAVACSIESKFVHTGDDNSKIFFDGELSLLKPYIDNESLMVPSGIKTYSEATVPAWKSEDAKKAMADRLNATGVFPGIILATDDVLADGVIQAVEEFGCEGEFPVITGLDILFIARRNIVRGDQSVTIDKGIASLADNIAMVLDSVISGSQVKTGFSVDNGVKDVPAIYSSSSLVTIDDLK